MSGTSASQRPALPNFAGLGTLLVEDNTRLRSVMVSSLQALGCEVRAAADAAEALEVLAQHPQLRLMISDVRMPGELDGIGLAQVALQRIPGLRVLLLTGYSSSQAPGFALLLKPFTLDELAAAITRVLEA